MELKIVLAKDEERFASNEIALFLAKKNVIKKLIEMDMAEKLTAESRLTEADADELADLVKESMYAKMKSHEKNS